MRVGAVSLTWLATYGHVPCLGSELMRHPLSNPEIAFLELGSPAVYELCVQGEMIVEWRDYLNTSSMSSTVDTEGFRFTVMTCNVLDQAQLLGILETLFGWRMCLCRLACITVPHGTNQSDLASLR